MAFELPNLPYAYDALQPFMSAETLQYHHDKHHKAYVDNLNKLLPGSGFEGKPLDRSSARLLELRRHGATNVDGHCRARGCRSGSR
mgnify:CR=1 FL=1